MPHVVGIDLGGSHLRLVWLDPQKRELVYKKIIVGAHKSERDIVALLSHAIEQTKPAAVKIFSVGLGVAGIVNPQKGVVYASPHYPEWRDFKLKNRLQQKIKMQVALDNDANCMAMAELHQGAGRGFANFIMLTLGTGIGGALVIDRKVFRGDNGFAGEVGHMVVEKNGSRCACGSRGCFETLVSGTAYRRLLKNSAKREVYRAMGRALGIGIASLVNVTGMQNIIIGGGLADSLHLLLPHAKKEICKRTYKKTASLIRIYKSRLGDKAGALGAALQILQS